MNRQLVLRNAWVRGLYGLLIAACFALFEAETRWAWMLVYASIGFCVGFFSRWLDYLLYLSNLRRRQFFLVLLVRSLAYLLLVALSIGFVLLVFSFLDNGTTVGELFRVATVKKWLAGGEAVRNIFYSFLVLLGMQALVLVSRLVGPTKVLNYLVGKYNEPVEEERIFMFVDLRSSTTIAEKLGHFEWHNFLNDYFYDIGRPVRRARGEIYQYVGDEVVISWPKELGIRKLNCINCFFWIYNLMNKRSQYYLDTYGFEPIFKAGYHVGRVIVGEIGDFKRDIVFHGDVVNTASRIQAECNARNRRLLLSGTLLEQLDLGTSYTSEYIDNIILRGKQVEVELHSLDPVE